MKKINIYSITLHILLVILAGLVLFLVKENKSLREAKLVSTPSVQTGDHIDTVKVTQINSADTLLYMPGNERVLLFMYSKNCPHCQKAIPLLKELYQTFKNEFSVLAVTKDPLTEIAEFIKTNNIPYPIFQLDQNLTRKPKMIYYPSIMHVRDGRIEKIWSSEINEQTKIEIRSYFNGILQHNAGKN